MDATATAVSNDPIIQMLSVDPNIVLTVRVVAAADVVPDVATFDVVIVQESFGSGNNILKRAGSLGIAGMPVPFIYNKAFALRSGLATTTSTGTAAESGSLGITVLPDRLNHPLFTACTISPTNEIVLLRGPAADNGSSGAKALNFTRGNVISAPNTLLAQPTGTTDAIVALNDFPAGTTIDSETLTSRMITIKMNFGAISANNGQNITSDALTIWRNAVYILAGLPIPNTKVGTGIDQLRDPMEVLSRQYFNLQGVEVVRPQTLSRSMYIVRTTYIDGSTTNNKVWLGN